MHGVRSLDAGWRRVEVPRESRPRVRGVGRPGLAVTMTWSRVGGDDDVVFDGDVDVDGVATVVAISDGRA